MSNLPTLNEYDKYEVYGMIDGVYMTHIVDTLETAKARYAELMSDDPQWAGIDGLWRDDDDNKPIVRLYYYQEA